MDKRIYVSTNKATGAQELIRAGTQSQAYRHAALETFHIKAATANCVAELMGKGVVVQEAGEQAEPPATE